MPGLQSTDTSRLATDKSAVAGHRINLGHCIQLQDTSVLSAKFRYVDRSVRRQVRWRSTPTTWKDEPFSPDLYHFNWWNKDHFKSQRKLYSPWCLRDHGHTPTASLTVPFWPVSRLVHYTCCLFLAFSLTLMMELICSSEMLVDFELHSVTTQDTLFFLITTVTASNPTR
jgi:hypothetical protein